MTPDELDYGCWSFTPKSPDRKSEVRCNECGKWSPFSAWRLGEVWCEDCGEHAAMVCPKCDHREDHVWSSQAPMQVRPAAVEGKT
jgi:Zn finger protein HypA/HybF involved in hydrogenase expression